METSKAPRRSNRRLSARHACHLAVRYRTGPGWHPATAMDLSRLGCRLRVGEDLARGARLAVAFEVPGHSQSRVLETDGAVIWSRFEGLSYQIGVLFESEPSGFDEILRLLLPVETPVI